VLSDEQLAALGVNELGRVVVGEWHIIGDVDREYRTSRETFRAQLQDLYDRGYRPVTQAEFLAGTFPIPAGTAPIVLTFDDSTRGQFDLDDDGEPVPDTAVGIIEAFAAEHPDWRATAVFAFNFPEPFGDAGYAEKLRWLIDNGYELSNHSVSHTNLGSLSSDEVVANLAENQARLHEVVPDAPVPSLTLPFGAHAQNLAVERAGTADGTTYLHELVYLVGAYPSRSPHDAGFDPMAVQRVPAHAVVGTGPEWFGDRLDDLYEPGARFVSDGDPATVTYPASAADLVGSIGPPFEVRVYGSTE
jgi:peptidoglycan/xylan/chitin deacetylase (PgdA/CDA1 family)